MVYKRYEPALNIVHYFNQFSKNLILIVQIRPQGKTVKKVKALKLIIKSTLEILINSE